MNTERKDPASNPILKVKAKRKNYDLLYTNAGGSLGAQHDNIISGSIPVRNDNSSLMESTEQLPELSS